jgi:hypothetical protein
MTTAEVLRRCVDAQIDAPAAHWLTAALRRAAHGPPAELLLVYTEASRHLGRAPLRCDPADPIDPAADLRVGRDGPPPLWPAFPPSHWALEDAGRLLLLLARHDASPGSSDDWAIAARVCFEQGDTREQQSWLRAVALLPDAPAFLPLVIDSCRTSILSLFEAVACENPYPAVHFHEGNFNQLVLKALFNGVALNRILGRASRLNPELARMASDYADERRAAGRSVPRDISLAMMNDMAGQRTDR